MASRHCFCGLGSEFGGGLQDEIDVLRAVGFAGARSVVGGDEDLREGFERGEIAGGEKSRFVVAQQRGFGRGGGMDVIVGGPEPRGKEPGSPGQRSGTHGKLQHFAASGHVRYFIPEWAGGGWGRLSVLETHTCRFDRLSA